jgi:hypothetical protein
MGQFGLNLDEHSSSFGAGNPDEHKLSLDDLQRIRTGLGGKRERSAVLFTIGLFVAGFAIGFLLLYFATGLHQYLQSPGA